MFVEETDFGRALFFNADGSLRWQYVNRSNDGAIYALSWSRILYKPNNLEQVNKFLESKGASILQMNLGRVGGILEAKKIAGFAETHYAQIAPHLYCGPIVGAANIQIATCSPNFLILEGIKNWGDFYSEILNEPIEWNNGYVIPSTKPGLGIELNENIASKFTYNGTKLHLEMESLN